MVSASIDFTHSRRLIRLGGITGNVMAANMWFTEREIAERSMLIKNMLEDCGEIEDAIPIANVRTTSGPLFSKHI